MESPCECGIEPPGSISYGISYYPYVINQYKNYTLIWLVGMLLVSRSGLVEEDAVEVFDYGDFHLSSYFLMFNFKSFQGK